MMRLAAIVYFISVLGCDAVMLNFDQGQEISQAFSNSAADYEIPEEILLAVSYLESNMTHAPSFVTYETTHVGTRVGETAFGISANRLGQKSIDDISTFPSQVRAYAEFVRSELESNNIQLPNRFQSIEDKMSWMWEIAKIQRQGNIYDTNLRSLYVLELIDVLNSGFTWRSPATNENISLRPQEPKIDRNVLTYPQQRLLNLKTSVAQVYQAQWFYPVEPQNDSEASNRPEKILVIHCPFSLSACLEIQNQSAEQSGNDAVLQAHYIIPANNSVIDYPLQIMHHHRQALLVDEHGTVQPHDDKIVIMLVGNSGRLTDNVRFPALPTWQSIFQLEWLGHIVRELCLNHLGIKDEEQVNACRDIKSPDSRVEFRLNAGNGIMWGAVPDFDTSIYASYAHSIKKIKTALVYPDRVRHKVKTRKSYASGENIRIAISNVGRHYYVLERLVRCNEQQLSWVVLNQGEASGKQEYNLRFYDGGANNDGTQFIRTKVYRKDKLVSWSIDSIMINNFNKDSTSSYYEECQSKD